MFPLNCMLIDTNFRIKVGKHFGGQPVLAIILNIINASQLSSGSKFLAGWAQSRSEARVQPAVHLAVSVLCVPVVAAVAGRAHAQWPRLQLQDNNRQSFANRDAE